MPSAILVLLLLLGSTAIAQAIPDSVLEQLRDLRAANASPEKPGKLSRALAAYVEKGLAPQERIPVVVSMAAGRVLTSGFRAGCLAAAVGAAGKEFANVTRKELALLLDDPDVRSVELQSISVLPPPPPATTTKAIEGPLYKRHISYLNQLHQSGIKGEGVKVGVVDRDFQSLLRKLPTHVKQIRRFGEDHSFPPGHYFANHGSSVIEIIHKIAPLAEIYAAQWDGTEGQLGCVLDWFKQLGVRVINTSLGDYHNPRDGTSRISRMIDEAAVKSNMLWVQSAGNYAELQYRGLGELSPIFSYVFPKLPFLVPRIEATGKDVEALLIWDDWEPTGQPLDVFVGVFALDVSTGVPSILVGESIVPPRGSGRPIREIKFKSVPGSQYWIVPFVSPLSGGPRRLPMRLQVLDGKPIPAEPQSSISASASTKWAITVGAVDTNATLEPYSSWGPSDAKPGAELFSGARKPDISGFTGYKTSYSAVFNGTSGAAPSVTGLAALLAPYKSDVQELRYAVLSAAAPLPSEPNKYGIGLSFAEAIHRVLSKDVRVPAVPSEVSASEPPPLRTLQAQSLESAFATKLVAGKTPAKYRLGDQIKLGLTTDRGCHFALYAVSGGGTEHVIDSGFLSAGEKHINTFTAAEPAGEEELLFVCSQRPWDRFDPAQTSVSRLSLVITSGDPQ